MIKKFGQPDSIVNNLDEVNSPDIYEKIYWGESSSYMAFSVDKIDLTKYYFNIDKIDLEDGHYITINSIVIDKNTTSKELINIFHENHHSNKIDDMILSIYVKKNKVLLDDSQIHFKIKQGKVRSFFYSVPSI